MPHIALLLVGFWFFIVFVLRTVVHWRRTGSTGLNGFRGRPGSISWIAGIMVSIGFVLALGAPLATLLGWPGGTLLFESRVVHSTGAVLLALGTSGTLASQLSLGDSWRVGVDETEETDLVTSGLFAWIRNPIFSFMGLSHLGLVLLLPVAVALLGALVATIGVVLQVRFVEEPYLLRTHGRAYADYASRVGRFVPRAGRMASAGAGLGGSSRG